MKLRLIVLLSISISVSAGAAEPSEVEEAYDAHATVGRDPSLGRQVFDAVALRPLGLIQTLVGAALFVPLYPVSLIVDGDEDLYRACLADPFERTFRRPLGSS